MVMNNKLLTIVVPCYNSAFYVRKCVDSLLTGRERVEIIIVNDGSTDDTGAIADSYASEYPDTVRVIHQENGGHGEGINQGLKHATGTYFKVVDSDDRLGEDELQTLLDRLDELEPQGGVDLVVTDYVYQNIHNINKEKHQTIRYWNIFPENEVVTWSETRPFTEHQYITIHSATFRTQLLRDNWVDLPKHTFYEDNLYIYLALPMTKKLLYLNIGLYHYTIGRDGQSVADQTMKKRYRDQIKVALQVLAAHDITAITQQERKLGKYMYHEAKMMFVIATVFARLNKTREADEHVIAMWDEASRIDPVVIRRMRYFSEAFWLNRPGRVGRALCNALFKFAHSIVRFN